jgi:hypothetical protein
MQMNRSITIFAGSLLLAGSAVAFGTCHDTVSTTAGHQPLRLLEITQQQLDRDIEAGLGITLPQLVVDQGGDFGVDHATAQSGHVARASGSAGGR